MGCGGIDSPKSMQQQGNSLSGGCDMVLTIQVISDLFYLVLALAYGIGALSLPEAMFGDPWAPRVYPLIIAGGMAILSVVLLVGELKKQRNGKADAAVRFSIDSDGMIVAFVTAASLLYTFLFNRLGFILSTFLFMESIMLFISKAKKMLWPTVIAIVFAVAVYFGFVNLLGVTLPAGILEF